MDLNLLSLTRREGQELPDLPGLHIAARPRRCARGRQPDRLLIYFVMEGNAPLGPGQQEQLLARLAQVYYKTPGSVTAALRATAENLNQILLERNLKSASSGQQGIGLLILAVLRNHRLYLAQCGPTHVLLIANQERQHFFDPQPARRGLGLGRTTPIHYSQASLNPNDILILAAQLPDEWEEALSGEALSLPLEALRPRLLRMTGEDVNAVLIQAREGPGKIFLLRPKPGEALAVPGGSKPAPPAAVPASPSPAAAPPAEAEVPPPAEEGIAPPSPEVVIDVGAEMPTQAPRAAGGRGRSRVRRPNPLSTFLTALGNTLRELSAGLGTLLRRMLPDESLSALPSSWMAFIAIAVPLVIVAVASAVYFQRGRAGQYEIYYALAVQSAEQARAQTDPQARHAAWQSVLAYLDQAEAYLTTSDSQGLRREAIQAGDELELIRRAEYRPALTDNLPGDVRIVELTATAGDLYLLDGNSGKALHAVSTNQGYEVDDFFQCGPGLPASEGSGELIDIQALPSGSAAALMGMDGQGNTLTCNPGDPPILEPLAPPYTQWGSIRAFYLDNNNLYVLDTEKNAVWIYWNSKKATQPEAFFTQDHPDMKDVVDLAVDKGDLYLLHADGRITLCTYSELGVAPTRCSDLPAIDSRPGHEGQPLMPQPAFSQIMLTQPPDPSIYLLEANTQAVYHFSRRLTYQRQIRPMEELSTGGDEQTRMAFTLSPDYRTIFLAIGNQVVYAGMP